MQSIPEKTYFALFRVSIVAKVFFSVGEILAGLAFTFLSYDAMRSFILPLFGDELVESSRDVLWTYVVQEIQKFQATPQAAWAAIFISHGVVNLLLLIGLWRNKLWVYPLAVVVFSFFMIYQFYQLTFTPSLVLWIVTIIDIAVIALIAHEYRYRSRRVRAAQG